MSRTTTGGMPSTWPRLCSRFSWWVSAYDLLDAEDMRRVCVCVRRLFQKFHVAIYCMKIATHELKLVGVSSGEFFFIGRHMDLSGIICDSENLARRKYSTVKAGKTSAVDTVWILVLKSRTNWCPYEVLSWTEMWDANQDSPPTEISRSTRFFNRFHRPVFLGAETRRFGNWICFRPKVKAEKTLSWAS
jgi:hypothetical protein